MTDFGPLPPVTAIIAEEPCEVGWREVGYHPQCFVDATFPC